MSNSSVVTESQTMGHNTYSSEPVDKHTILSSKPTSDYSFDVEKVRSCVLSMPVGRSPLTGKPAVCIVAGQARGHYCFL